MRTIYCISGLGADTRMYDEVQFPVNYEVKKLEWLPYEGETHFDAYVQKHIQYYGIKEGNVICGLSLGGIAASFIQDFVPQYKLILISSIAHRNQLPGKYLIPGLYSVYRFISPLFRWITPFAIRVIMKPGSKKSKDLLSDYIRKIDHNYVNWVFGEVLRWQKKSPHENVIQIHGTRDRVFPYKNVSAHYLIKGGTHFMLRDKSNEISRILEEELANV